MFIERLLENNKELVEFAFKAHRNGEILPDTYVLDLDTIVENGRRMKQEADKYGIRLYFMLKQIGRNPVVAKALMDIGFDGCVAVDYKEALLMIEHGIKLGNVGHLEQIPTAALKTVLKSEPEIVTVYSLKKIMEINEVCKQLGRVQPLLLKPLDDNSELYSGQVGGFRVEELPEVIDIIDKMENVCLGGFTAFPALLFNSKSGRVEPTENMSALRKALALTEERKGLNINLPSVSCSGTMELIHSLKGNSAEPGHGLTGTTPLHKATRQPENIGYVYVSEISHNFKDKGYCYGGGHYRRSHMEKAIVGRGINDFRLIRVKAPTDESIDYHFELQENAIVGDTCLMCFRTQVFTTRSHVAVVKGLRIGKPEIIGLYSATGEEIRKNW